MKLSDYVQKIRKEQEATVAGILDSELPEVYKLKLFSEFRLLGTSRFAVPIFADCDTEAKNAAIARMVFAQCVKTGCIAYIYDW